MTAKEVFDRLIHFIDNDFTHLQGRVESQAKTTTRFFISLIIGLIGVIGGLIYLIVR